MLLFLFAAASMLNFARTTEQFSNYLPRARECKLGFVNDASFLIGSHNLTGHDVIAGCILTGIRSQLVHTLSVKGASILNHKRCNLMAVEK